MIELALPDKHLSFCRKIIESGKKQRLNESIYKATAIESHKEHNASRSTLVPNSVTEDQAKTVKQHLGSDGLKVRKRLDEREKLVTVLLTTIRQEIRES